jgi:hypothetical protein
VRKSASGGRKSRINACDPKYKRELLAATKSIISAIALPTKGIMLVTSLLHALPAALLLIGVNATRFADRQDRLKRATLEEFIETQADISIKGVLANIGPDGSKAQGVPAGIVVASPSRSNPDC